MSTSCIVCHVNYTKLCKSDKYYYGSVKVEDICPKNNLEDNGSFCAWQLFLGNMKEDKNKLCHI